MTSSTWTRRTRRRATTTATSSGTTSSKGLSVYWRGQTIMENTRTKKLAKRYTPFSYKHTVTDALRRTFKQFQDSTIVLSYSSNAVPDADTIEACCAR